MPGWKLSPEQQCEESRQQVRGERHVRGSESGMGQNRWSQRK